MKIKMLIKKLNSRAGESLAETLVALLISALALVMLAAAITSAGNVVTKSRKKLDDFYSANEHIVTRTDDETIEVVPGHNVTITGGGSSLQPYSVTIYKNDEFGKYPVVSYKH